MTTDLTDRTDPTDPTDFFAALADLATLALHAGTAPDPTTVEFSSESLYGETYYPAPCKGAGLLIELGERLIDYCKASPDKRAAVSKALEAQAAALETFLKHHS